MNVLGLILVSVISIVISVIVTLILTRPKPAGVLHQIKDPVDGEVYLAVDWLSEPTALLQKDYLFIKVYHKKHDSHE